MKAKQIRFFSPNENSESTKKNEKSVAKAAPVTGYISSTGRLVFPAKSITQLGFDPTNSRFKVGILALGFHSLISVRSRLRRLRNQRA